MSITYDPQKWTNPLRTTEVEGLKKKSSARVLVSIDETRYFKMQKKSAEDDAFNRILSTGNLIEKPREVIVSRDNEENKSTKP